jgi:hypothetical protein
MPKGPRTKEERYKEYIYVWNRGDLRFPLWPHPLWCLLFFKIYFLIGSSKTKGMGFKGKPQVSPKIEIFFIN